MTEATRLATLIDEYLRFVWSRDPIEATQTGVHDYDTILTDLSRDGYAAELRDRAHYLARFEAIDRGRLDADAAMDLDAALIDVRTGLRRLEERPVWNSAPYWIAEQLGTAFSALMRGDNGDATGQGEALLARLRQAPGYLATARANLDAAATAALHVGMGRTAVTGLQRFLADSLPGYAATLPAALAREIVQVAAATQSALADFAAFLAELEPAATGSFACGAEYFDFLLREYHLLDIDHRQLVEFGRTEMAQDKANLEAFAMQLDPDTPWPAQIELIKDHHPQGNEFLAAYRDAMVAARRHCVDQDLITLPPGEVAIVEWLPEYMRAGAPLGLMFTTPHFAPGLASSLVITPLDPDAPLEQQVQHMRDNCYAFARSITLHEIYPGHHTQKVHHKLATAHSPMRRHFSSPLLVEGWGLYTEDLMEETGFMVDPAVRLFKLRNALWRSARVVVDSGLHTRGMRYDEAVQLMVDEVQLDRRMAEGEVRRYTTHDNPTYPSAYLLGKVAIHALRRQWWAQQDLDYSLKRFHDTLLSYGSPPVKLIAGRMLA
jgi:uncharacterized protein (DUF885 family)